MRTDSPRPAPDTPRDQRTPVAVHLTHESVACWHFTADHAEALRRRAPGMEPVVCATERAFLTALETARIALVWRFRQEWFGNAPHLRWIATPAAGRDYFRVEPPDGVEITYGAFHGPLMAETVVGCLLAASRGILAAAATPAIAWPRGGVAAGMRRLAGSTATIVGFGRIGTAIGQRLHDLGVTVRGVRRHAGHTPPWFGRTDRCLTVDDLDAALPTTDHLILVLPSGRETDNLLDHRRLALLPAHATVTNVGRGNAVDESALAEGLRRGALAWACLDVFRNEPLPADSPLLDCPRLLRLPHVSAVSPDYLDLFIDELAAAWHRRRAGGT